MPRTSAADCRRIALYSHDTVGLGHLRRNLAIASTLVAGPVPTNVLLISGSRETTSFPVPAGVDVLALPALTKRSGAYAARTFTTSLDEVVQLRSAIIDAALACFDPDVFLVDKVARGVCGELDLSLERLAARGRARCVLGLRDILDDPTTTCAEWEAAELMAAVTEWYDAVWVYGDATVFDLPEEYAWSPAATERATFTGYLGLGRPHHSLGTMPSVVGAPYALCLVGGGEDGVALADAFTAAALPGGLRAVVVTGPYMDVAERRRLCDRAARRADLTVIDFLPDCAELIDGAEAVVSMGGYNTVCELLAAGERPLIVPRVTPRTEQLIRAQRLAERGLVDVLHPAELSPGVVADWLSTRDGTAPAARRPVDLDGLSRIPGLVEQLLDRTSSRGVLAHDAA